MTRTVAYRDFVSARAGAACEYCRLLEAPTGVVFHLEHILPQSQGSETTLSNLALSCPGCNLAKSNRTSGADLAGLTQPLFNPRDYEPSLLGWHLNFALDRDTGMVVARTPMGEATVSALKMNDALRLFARKLQLVAGLIA